MSGRSQSRNLLLVCFALVACGLAGSSAWVSPPPPTSSRRTKHFSTTRHQRQNRGVCYDASRNKSISDDRPLVKDWRTSWERVIRQTVASVPFAALLVFLQLTTTTPIPASASENPARSPQEISTTLPSAERRTALAETTLLTALQQDSTTALDEAWTLIDKYYIDRSFGGQDWKAVKEKYTRLAAGVKGDAALLKLTTEMVNTLGDKYSRILDPKQYAAIQKYDLIGVGVTLMPDQNKHIVVGAPPIAGSAADRAGLRQGDFVTAINGISTAGRTAFDIIDQISEHPNAPTVAMTVRPVDGAEAATEIVMERTFEEVKDPVRYRISETRPDGTKVGLIKITEFNSLVKGSLEKALSELRDAGANAYVLDIRQNTGGAFQSAVEISGLFVEDRVATYVVDNTDVKLPFRTPKGRLLVDPSSPLVIWMDGRSASASEVLAGSLHDNCRAVLMGEKTFGKGLIQAVYGLKNGAGLVLTVARYVTPSGSDIQGVGIAPDVSGNIGPFGLGTDTSKIDFGDVSRRLSVTTCKVPEAVGS